MADLKPPRLPPPQVFNDRAAGITPMDVDNSHNVENMEVDE
jgi:hypothetical protein